MSAVHSTSISVGAETVQIRRITWPEFWKIRPDLRPANDNKKPTDKAGIEGGGSGLNLTDSAIPAAISRTLF